MARVFPLARPGKLRCSLIVTGPGHQLILNDMEIIFIVVVLLIILGINGSTTGNDDGYGDHV